MDTDSHIMHTALNLARRGLGRTAPNPAVGCVLVKNGITIARGWTSDGGRPHAEINALDKAGPEAKGATAYVSLEPCSHTGQTGPCAQALIDAGIKRAVIACSDPDPRVSGRGIAMLEEAGVEVRTGVLEEEARALNRGFFLRVTENRPLVTLKIATSADGRIAARKGERTQISGPLAQTYAHLERARHDAILIGIETLLADNPRLTTRLKGMGHHITRIVMDTNLRTPPDAVIFEDIASNSVIILHNSNPEEEEWGEEEERAVTFIKCDTRNIKACLAALAERGITRLLVEGGAQIHESFIHAGYVDRFLHLQSPVTLGEEGVPYNTDNIPSRTGLKHAQTRILGEDRLDIYGLAP